MKSRKILEIMNEFVMRGEEIELITIHPKDLIDLLQERDLLLFAQEEKGIGRVFGIKLEIDLKVPEGQILINQKHLRPGWNPSSRE